MWDRLAEKPAVLRGQPFRVNAKFAVVWQLVS